MRTKHTLHHHRLKSLRELRNYTQEYVSEMLGISQSYYCKIENNRARLNVNQLYQLGNILDLDVSTLLSDSEPVPSLVFSSDGVDISRVMARIEQLEKRIGSLESKRQFQFS